MTYARMMRADYACQILRIQAKRLAQATADIAGPSPAAAIYPTLAPGRAHAMRVNHTYGHGGALA
ncbi:hypothetical protein [Streptomyces roseoverticillatus]|uniref:hypothetical protein n=1 Tax=Streptomyces roseoverticillatus TaxID=66429 RepID=UPI0004BE8FAA|nr:hypothetical protein [Streptomyces roseoverticillatus]